MGAKQSSAVQQSAYLEALDDYIDFYEDGTLSKCLLDEHGWQQSERCRREPENLCPIRNMTSLFDVSQVKAFLGCCQQMSQYIK